MTTGKIKNNKQQIKLVFNGGSEAGFNLEGLVEQLGLEWEALTTSAGILVMSGIMEDEVKYLAGALGDRTTPVNRWGKQRGYVMVGGQKAPVERRRLRDKNGKEVQLTSYARFQDRGNRTQAVFQRLVSGLSCRNYPRAIEAVRDGYGVSKSVVNREMVEATSRQLKELCERDLSGSNFSVLIIDGLHIGDSVYIVALGVEAVGNKQIIGFREGSTENADVCVKLFEEMVGRGLRTGVPVLVVIDGSKALRSAVERFYGDGACVQRCQVHKRKNVQKHLPDKYHAEYDRKMLSAYKMTSYADAKQALESIARELERINEDAARSLREGMEETLTLHRLEASALLRKSFSSTNLIESAFSLGRTTMRNVKRWMNSGQRHRWIATALAEGEKKFHKVRGYKSMAMLVNAIALEVQRKKNKIDSDIMVA
jgi:transposase-like protein